MAQKTEMRDRIKALWIRGMKAVGNTAANIANNTRYKVDEVTIQNRRREVLGDLANKAYALWLKGEPFPESMTKMLQELKQLDEQLNDMRAEKYAASNMSAPPAEVPDTAPETDDEEDDPEDFPAGDSPLGAEINELFDGVPSVGRTAEKVNQSLDQLSDRIRNFPQSDRGDETEQRQE